MKFLALERELKGKKAKDFEPHLKSEAKKVWDYYKKGIIREIYFTKENHTAVIILECQNKKRAVQVLNSLPLVKNKLIAFDVFELIVYNGLERLFA